VKQQGNKNVFTGRKPDQHQINQRRKLLGIIGVGGLVSAWHKPIINSITLPAHAQTSTNTPTVTTTGSVSSMAIPDQTSINIDVPLTHPDGSPTMVSKVVLSLDIEHGFQGDIIISLTSPSGMSSVLVDRVGTGNTEFGCSDSDFSIVLDDDAAPTLPFNLGDCPAGAISGTFSTSGALRVFNGESPNGTWVLTIEDSAQTDGGMLNQAVLSVTCA